MSEEKKSIAQLLRTADVYREAEHSPAGDQWREAVLMDLDSEAAPAAAIRPDTPETAPLRPRHLLMMAPAGVALFFAGWWIGRGGVSGEEMAAVPTAVWIACAGLAAGMALLRWGRAAR